jgi:hypothetical protein
MLKSLATYKDLLEVRLIHTHDTQKAPTDVLRLVRAGTRKRFLPCLALGPRTVLARHVLPASPSRVSLELRHERECR